MKIFTDFTDFKVTVDEDVSHGAMITNMAVIDVSHQRLSKEIYNVSKDLDDHIRAVKSCRILSNQVVDILVVLSLV